MKDLGYLPQECTDNSLKTLEIDNAFKKLGGTIEKARLYDAPISLFYKLHFPKILAIVLYGGMYLPKGLKKRNLPQEFKKGKENAILLRHRNYNYRNEADFTNSFFYQSNIARDKILPIPPHSILLHETIHNTSKSLKTAYFRAEDPDLAVNALEFLLEEQLTKKQLKKIRKGKLATSKEEKQFLENFSIKSDVEGNSDILSSYLMGFSCSNSIGFEERLATGKRDNPKISFTYLVDRVILRGITAITGLGILESIATLSLPNLLMCSFAFYQWYTFSKAPPYKETPILEEISEEERLAIISFPPAKKRSFEEQLELLEEHSLII